MVRPESEQRPLTDDEHEQLQAAIEELSKETRQYLADELDGDSADDTNG